MEPEKIRLQAINEILDIITTHAEGLYDLAERKWRLVHENDENIHAKITTCETLAHKIRGLST